MFPGVNRTVINKAAFQDDDAPPGGPQYANGMNPGKFHAGGGYTDHEWLQG